MSSNACKKRAASSGNADYLSSAAKRIARAAAEIALLCEHALTAADRLDVLEREHAEFFKNWHEEKSKRETFEALLREIEPELNDWDFPITLGDRVRTALGFVIKD